MAQRAEPAARDRVAVLDAPVATTANAETTAHVLVALESAVLGQAPATALLAPV